MILLNVNLLKVGRLGIPAQPTINQIIAVLNNLTEKPKEAKKIGFKTD